MLSFKMSPGQVVNALREERLPLVAGYRPQITTHVTVPSHYRSGMTLFAAACSPAFDELRRACAELPIEAAMVPVAGAKPLQPAPKSRQC